MIKYTNKYTDKSFDIAKCRESAESGYAPAQYQLGQCYTAGRGVAEDYSHAVRRLRMMTRKLNSGLRDAMPRDMA